MLFEPTAIAGAFAVRHDVRSDPRGSFARTYCEREFAAAGLNTRWVQANRSITRGLGSIRGLHFQKKPAAETKLVSCAYGRAFDVAVDLRRGSATFLDWIGVEIDEATSFYIPAGCAHGFQALTEELGMNYLHSEFYAPEAEGGLRFDDPALAIAWPLAVGTVSGRDRSFALRGAEFEGLDL